MGRLGPYELERELARGGQGVVYVARRPGLDREVAVKVLLAGQASPEEVQRFLVEARTASRLQHRNVVRIHDVGQEGGNPYLVMELVRGGSLRERLERQGPLAPRDAALLCARLARALAYAHEQAVLHRDLKPHNVLLDAEGEPVLTDFGLAKDVGADGVTRTGQVMGTPAYMPPEQAGGERERVDRRADVYSLGATLYHALTGQPPFAGPTALNVMHAVLTEEPRRPRALRRELDRDLETVVLRCLEKDPDARYPTMSALADDLERWLRDEPILARAPGLGERLARWVRRNRALSVTVGLATGLLLVGGLAAAGWALSARRAERARLAAEAGEQARARWEEARAQRGGGAGTGGAQTGGAGTGGAQTGGAQTGGAGTGGAQTGGAQPGGAQTGGGARPGEAALTGAWAALLAAERWRALAPDDAAARALAHEVALALARAAASSEQWSLAEQACKQAAASGHDPAAAAAALDEVRRARDAGRQRRLDEVRALLSSARSGALRHEPDGLEGAALTITRYTESGVTALLVEALDEVTGLLNKATRISASSAAMRGGAEGEVFERAMRRRAARGLGPELTDALDRQVLASLSAQGGGSLLQERLRRSQRLLVGQGELDLARVCVRALGGRPAAAEPLARHLWALADEERAVEAAQALLRTGDPRAAPAVQARQREGFGDDGPYERFLVARRLWGHDELLRGRELNARSDYAAALEALREAPATDPRTWEQRALALSSLGRHADALAAAERGLALEPRPAMSCSLHMCRGIALAGLGRAAEAKEALAAAERSDPQATAPRAFLGKLELARGAVKEAAEIAQDLMNSDPLAPEAYALLAAARLAAGDPRGAVQASEWALRLDPRHEDALRLEGQALLGEGLLSDALSVADHGLGLCTGRASIPFLLLRAEALTRLQELERARVAYDRALELDPQNALALAGRGKLRYAGLLDPAGLEDLRAAARLKPDAELLELWAQAHQLREEWDQVAELLARAAARAPGDARLRARLAALPELRAESAELQDEAALARRLARIEALLASDPAAASKLLQRTFQVRGRSAALLMAAGRIAESKSDVDAAATSYGRASHLDPHLAQAWLQRARIAYLREQLPAAEALAERALAEDEHLADAWLLRGNVRQRLGDEEGALAAWARALQEAPGHILAHAARGRLLALRGRRDEARAHLRAWAAQDAYGCVWLAGLYGEQGEQCARFAQRADWDGALARFALGRLSAAQLVAAAGAKPGAERDTCSCEALGYAGMFAERDGDLVQARARYRACVALDIRSYMEHEWAAARLAALARESPERE
ncbi:MAG: protein kinase [Planctomycetota bacterium]